METTVIQTFPYDALSPHTREDHPGGFDQRTGQPIPGFRGEDQLLVYDESYGQKSTGTNYWGVELLVDRDGTILRAAGGDSPIPEGGLVISGNGRWSRPLTEVDPFGVRVTLDREHKEVRLETSPALLRAAAEKAVCRLEKTVRQAEEKLLDIDYTAVQALLGDIREKSAALAGFGDEDVEAPAREVGRLAVRGQLMCLPTLRVEKRAVWYRASETCEKEVEETVRYVKSAGLTAIYLESWYEGFTIWPSAIPGVRMLPGLKGFDVLEAFVRIGHRMGIEIHAWVETFMAGIIPPGKDNTPENVAIYAPLIADHPHWALTSRQGSRASYIPFDRIHMYFMNPMEEEARDLVSRIYQEMVSRYDLDGVNFDYVRFPQPNQPGDGSLDDFGFCDNIVAAYREHYGTDPYEITEQHPQWRQWCHFRAELINTFVYRTADELHTLRPGLSISVAIWANFEEAATVKYQESMDWVTKGYIDEVFTMSYYMDLRPVLEETHETRRRAEDQAFSSTGIAAFMDVPRDLFLDMLLRIRDENTAGAAIFALGSFREKKMEEWLRPGLYREDAAASPDRVPQAVPALLEDMLRRIRTLYVPKAGGTEDNYGAPSIQRLLNQLTDSSFDDAGCARLEEEAQRQEKAAESLPVSLVARQLLSRDWQRIRYLLRVYRNRLAALSRGNRHA